MILLRRIRDRVLVTPTSKSPPLRRGQLAISAFPTAWIFSGSEKSVLSTRIHIFTLSTLSFADGVNRLMPWKFAG